MTTARNLKTRLTLLTTIILVVMLGAGGFFLYYSQRQQLFAQLDSELEFTATLIGGGPLNSATAEVHALKICRKIADTASHDLTAQLFNAQGEPLCGNNSRSFETDQIRFPLQHIPFVDTVTSESGETFRRRIQPLAAEGKPRHYLQLDRPVNSAEETLRFFALLLLFFGAIITVCTSSCLWLLLSLLTTPIHRLARVMNQTTEENLPQTFQTVNGCGKEVEELASGYNGMASRLAISLQKAQQFSADVTHELRTPLTILRGETELALRGEKDNEQLKQTLGSNLEEFTRMSRLIDDLLLLSKSELGEIPLSLEAINLGSLLDELHFQAQIIATEKNIRVNIERSEVQISLLADALRLRQAFLNLLSNAIKYTPEGGTVTITWTLKNSFAQIRIKDTGIGIDNKHQEHIFDRFYRIDKARNCHDGGSGLGLSITNWIVNAHNGSIRVCSDPGKGSCFTIMLPLTHRPDSTADEEINF